MEKEDVYKKSGVPHKGRPYMENGKAVYWTNISAEEAKKIRSDSMQSTDLATGKTTPALEIKTFGGELFAKWEAQPFQLEEARRTDPIGETIRGIQKTSPSNPAEKVNKPEPTKGR